MPDLATLTDAELVRAFREGRSDRAFEQLLGRYVAHQVVDEEILVRVSIADYDDLEQEARIAFLGAVNSMTKHNPLFRACADVRQGAFRCGEVDQAPQEPPAPGMVVLSTSSSGCDGDDDVIEAVQPPQHPSQLSWPEMARRLWVPRAQPFPAGAGGAEETAWGVLPGIAAELESARRVSTMR